LLTPQHDAGPLLNIIPVFHLIKQRKWLMGKGQSFKPAVAKIPCP